MQKMMSPSCEDGFTAKIGKTQIPIFAFADAASAQAYAQMIGASDTNAAIVSGRFLAMADMKDGAVNVDQKAALEKMQGIE